MRPAAEESSSYFTSMRSVVQQNNCRPSMRYNPRLSAEAERSIASSKRSSFRAEAVKSDIHQGGVGGGKYNATGKLRDLKEYKYCVILPDERWKVAWDFFIILLILFSGIYTPFRIAFYEQDTTFWIVLELVVDAFFLMDILLTFVSAYYDHNETLIDQRSRIACSYVRSWFAIDVVSVFPLSLIMEGAKLNSLGKLARLPRIYRFVKVLKLFRMMKFMKARRHNIRASVNGGGSSSGGGSCSTVATGRVSLWLLIFFILCHTMSCLWVIIANLEDLEEDTWIARYNLLSAPIAEVYVSSFYFTVTTITTVGYGDFHAQTVVEMMVAICLMVLGVVGYSMAIGALSSVISNIDSRQARYKERLNTLNSIRREFDMKFDLYWRLRQSLHRDAAHDTADKQILLKELPLNLRVELSNLIYSYEVKDIDFFKAKSAHFIARVAPVLRAVRISKGEFVYLEEDPIDAIYFIKKGEAAFVYRRTRADLVYAVNKEGTHFGDIEFVFSTEEEEARRQYSVKALSDLELLVLEKDDLYALDLEFKLEILELFENSLNRNNKLQVFREKAMEWFRSRSKSSRRLQLYSMQQQQGGIGDPAAKKKLSSMRHESVTKCPLPPEEIKEEDEFEEFLNSSSPKTRPRAFSKKKKPLQCQSFK